MVRIEKDSIFAAANTLNLITMKRLNLIILLALAMLPVAAQQKTLQELQQDFVDLRFGMFIHYNIPTYSPEDWPDPDLPASVFNPTRLDCRQWARAAKAANMSYGCLTTKHHSGFCIWDTKTTDYNSMNSPAHRDVVREYVDAFRAEGLKVMLYYSILDTHHKLRPGFVTRDKVQMLKAQLKELLTGYGEVAALIIDGWDAPWSRISYDEVPFQEIYEYVKSLQPNCLVMDLNAAKYPREALFYTDIKSYEQGAGQKISTTENSLPALACLPIQRTWFWKESMPTDELQNVEWLVKENIIPYNKAYCNFILNVAPNRDGLMDDNAVAALKKIGKMWKNDGRVAEVPAADAPIIQHNIAKFRPVESSWGYDCNIMDLANDDDFTTAWISHPLIEKPYFEVTLDGPQSINMVTMLEHTAGGIQEYNLEYLADGEWHFLASGTTFPRFKAERFPTVKAEAVRLNITKHNGKAGLCEFGVYRTE